MEINLSTEAQPFIESQVQQGLHGSPGEVIEALVQEKQGRQAVRAQEAQPDKQRAKILQVIEECEQQSSASPQDPFSNREHNRVLYGGPG